MNRSTSFDFGFNVRDNADPWGQNTGPDGAVRQNRQSSGYSKNRNSPTEFASPPNTDSGPVSDLALPESEFLGKSGFFGVTYYDIQTDAFLKTVMLGLNQFREEIRKMAQLPAPNQQTSTGKNGGGRKPSSSGGTRQGIPFLKVEQMTAEPKKAKIMDLQIPPDPPAGQRKFNDIVLKIYYNGTVWLWGLKASSPHYAGLTAMFGGDSDNWIDQEFLLGTETREFDGRTFAHVEPTAKTQERVQRAAKAR